MRLELVAKLINITYRSQYGLEKYHHIQTSRSYLSFLFTERKNVHKSQILHL